MKLEQLIRTCDMAGLNPKEASENPDIIHISSDSRKIKPGSLFIAVKGLDADGHDYIESALANGALAVVAQKNVTRDSNVILVDDSRMAEALIAAEFYGQPSSDMALIGITGTNGKTTITWLLESILDAAGFKTGVIGTVNIRYGGKVIENPYTTPDPIFLHQMLAKMKSAGITHVIMEVSSHGLALNRVDGCSFNAGIFTNLTQDHLDFHADMDDYFDAKKRLFSQFLSPEKSPDGFAVINTDDEKGRKLAGLLECRTITVSAKHAAGIQAVRIEQNVDGLTAALHTDDGSDFDIQSELTGSFNLENILCAVGTAKGLGIDNTIIRQGLLNCSAIPGRLEKVNNTVQRHLFVDYAHTPDALNSVLTTLAPYAKKRLITVFGCGGDRDAGKRPLMGQAACSASDLVIITSDNPRTENPDSIVKDIVAGLNDFTQLEPDKVEAHPFAKGYLIEKDRKKAIQLALELSRPDDIILVAGKGHEDYQITSDGKIHFDDREQLAAAAGNMTETFAPIPWTLQDISDALNTDPQVINDLDTGALFSGVSTDSRTISRDEIFVALKGENLDGHLFVAELIKNGIKAVIVANGFLRELSDKSLKILQEGQAAVYETVNTLEALGKLAAFQRTRSGVKVLALTGSSGKTTTRKLSQSIFNSRYHTLATQGNLNNEIGLPLTLLKLSAAHQWAIVEMGMNHPGEIERLSAIARPDIAMVVNTGAVHLEGLQSVENVARAKAEIFKGAAVGATAILNADDKRFHILEYGALKNSAIEKVVLFGTRPDADLRLANVHNCKGDTCFTVEYSGKSFDARLPSPARFMVENCLAAITAAKAAGIDTTSIQKGIAAFTPEKGRLNFKTIHTDIHLIDDTYNANPESVSKGLETLVEIAEPENSFAVLGDMLELGDHSEELHWNIGKKAAQLKIAKLFTYGPMAVHIIEGALENGFAPENTFSGAKNEIADKLAQHAGRGIWVLVKGSRGMAMETVIQELEKKLNRNS